MDLSPRGHEQAVALAEHLRQQAFAAIYASPMRRVQQTLAALLQGNGVPTPVILPNLREVDFGNWTGLSFTEVQHQFGVRASSWLDQFCSGAIPTAEDAANYRGRIEPCVQEIVQRHPGQSVAVFCHGGVIRQVIAILLDLPLPKTAGFEIAYASVTEIEIHPHRAEIQLLNFTPWRHLNSKPVS